MMKNMTMTGTYEVLLPWHAIVYNQSDVALCRIIVLRYNEKLHVTYYINCRAIQIMKFSCVFKNHYDISNTQLIYFLEIMFYREYCLL